MENFRQYKPPSSKIPILPRKEYDVFLSFRGPDVRKTLVDHLYQSLSTAGLNVFIDSEKLEKGENIGMNLEKAIHNSTIYIPIFSPDYATSAWCLKELSLMWIIKSSSRDTKVMIPLFYNVEPSHVRYPENRGGPYAEAFNKHRTQRRHSPEDIEGWTDALYEVSCLSGWSLKETTFGFEGKLVKHVVKDLLQALDIGVLDVAKRPVGLIPRSEEVIQLLKLGDKTSDRLTLGIWGMGGLGKTTLSKALYNKIHHLFEASSFVSVAKLDEPSQGLRKLQQQILRDLLNIQMKVNNIDQGKILMRNHLASLRALVVLDDVDNVRQLDALMGDWFGEGSRIIITTRDKRVLEVGQVDVIYPIRGLELAEGVELFSWHAFLRDRPERGYEDMTQRIVKTCSGLPLSLKIVGTDLYNRNKRYWHEALQKLKNVGHDSVFKTLKISYDTLAPVEKHIFLDIACFFVNLKSSIFIQNRAFNMDFYDRFWSALGCEPVCTSLKILEEKALIVVHAHRYSEAIDEDVDEEDDAGQYFCEFSMHEQIRDMGRRIVVEESKKDPTKRSRVWREEDIHTLMAATTNQENSNVKGLMWRKHMELQHIDNLAAMPKLDFLLWWKLQLKIEIERLPTNLKYLVLSECQLKDCNPQMAGIESGSVHALQALWNAVVLWIPISTLLNYTLSAFGNLRKFSQRPVLPKSIAQLRHLRHLDMSGTKQTCLPKEVCELHCLEELYLSRCSLEALPEAFGNLIRLKTLDVSNNSLIEFPPSFGLLESLVNLEMAWNEQLVVFPALPEGLVTLNARRCSKLQIISLKNAMSCLKTMDLSHCKNLTRLPLLDWWLSLRDLNLEGCKQLVKLDPLPPNVASLRISGCSQLQKFSFHQMSLLYPFRVVNAQVPRPLRRPRPPSRAPPVSVVCYGAIGPPRPPRPPPPQMQRVCMIGCDNIRLNIYQLLEDLEYLEQLDLSVPRIEESLGETQPLVGQKDLIVQGHNSSVAVLVCFVFDSNENVRLPEMEVGMTFMGVDRGLYSRTFKLPPRMKTDGSGKNILRVCVWNGWSSAAVQFFDGMISCSYSVQDQLSQCGSPVLLKQVEILPLRSDATSQVTTQFLHQWKLLSSSNDIAEEEREVRHSEGDVKTTSSEQNKRITCYFFFFYVLYVLVVLLAISNSK